MIVRPLSRIVLAAAALVVVTLAGCASRSLNPPPVIDWSNSGPATSSSAAPATVAQGPRYYTIRRDDTLASIARQFNTTPAELAQWNRLAPNARLKVDSVLRVNSPTVPAPAETPSVATASPVGTETVEQRPLGTSAPSASTVVPPGPSPSVAPSNVPDKSGPLGVKRPYSDATFAELSRPDGDAPAPVVSSPSAAPSAVPSAAAPAPAPTVTWAWPAPGKPGTVFGDGKTKGIDIPGKAGDPVLAAADGTVTFVGARVRGYGNFVIVRHSPQLLSVYAHNRTNLVTEGAVVRKGQKIAEMGDSDTDAVKLHFEIRNDSKPVDPLKFLPER